MRDHKVMIWASLLFFLMLLPGLGKEKAKLDSPPKPLSEIMNADGTLNLREGVEGSFDPRGFRMIAEPGEAPRFVPASLNRDGGRQTRIASAPGDEYWDDQFGVPGADKAVMTFAVSGSTLYAGGCSQQPAE